MSDDESTTGGCLCGAVRFAVRGVLRDAIVCHCTQCRRWHGRAVAYTACAPGNLAMTGELAPAWYRSSPRAERGFCPRCGSSLFFRPGHLRHVSIAAGCLDRPIGLRIASQIYCADAADHDPPTPALPTYDAAPDPTVLALVGQPQDDRTPPRGDAALNAARRSRRPG